MAKKSKKAFKRSTKSVRSVKKSAKKSKRKLGDAAQDSLEAKCILQIQAKLSELEGNYDARIFINTDPIQHLEKQVKLAHWVRSLQNQTIN